MLRTFVSSWLGIASPPAPRTRRASAPWTPRKRRPRNARVTAASVAPTVVLAPWGELPALRGLAVVTTQPFPDEWWRKPRIAPPPADPFQAGANAPNTPNARPIEQAAPVMEHRPMPPVARAHTPHATDHAQATDRAPRSRAERRGHEPATDRRRVRGRFARLCLVVAGALISWIVVDAAAGHGRS